MGLFDTVTVDVLSAAFQTKQLGEGMLTYGLAEVPTTLLRHLEAFGSAVRAGG